MSRKDFVLINAVDDRYRNITFRLKNKTFFIECQTEKKDNTLNKNQYLYFIENIEGMFDALEAKINGETTKLDYYGL